MEYVDIDYQPNQRLTLNIANTILTLRIQTFRDCIYCSVYTAEGESVVLTKPCVHNGWILPRIAESRFGNFRFEDDNEEYPNFKNFGKTCFLRHYSATEVDFIRKTQENALAEGYDYGGSV
jgi:hypothetical protein